MTGLLYLIPLALCLGLGGLAAFIWAAKSGQFDDPEGARYRILIDEDHPKQMPHAPDEDALHAASAADREQAR